MRHRGRRISHPLSHLLPRDSWNGVWDIQKPSSHCSDLCTVSQGLKMIGANAVCHKLNEIKSYLCSALHHELMGIWLYMNTGIRFFFLPFRLAKKCPFIFQVIKKIIIVLTSSSSILFLSSALLSSLCDDKSEFSRGHCRTKDTSSWSWCFNRGCKLSHVRTYHQAWRLRFPLFSLALELSQYCQRLSAEQIVWSYQRPVLWW